MVINGEKTNTDIINNFKTDHLNSEEFRKLKELIEANCDVFSFDGKLGKCEKFEFEIELESNQPIYTPPYPISPKEKKEQKNQIEEMLKEQIIETCLSSYGSPVVMVTKKDGTFRFCVN